MVKIKLLGITLLISLLLIWQVAEAQQRIGVYAGSFDPIHEGHIDTALTALKTQSLDKVYIIPLGRSSQKSDLSPLDHRLNMVVNEVSTHQGLATLPIDSIKEISDLGVDKLFNMFQVQGAQVFQIVGDDALVKYRENNLKFVQQGIQFLVRLRILEKLPDEFVRTGSVTALPPGLVTGSFKIRENLKKQRDKQPENLSEINYQYILKNGLYFNSNCALLLTLALIDKN